MSFWLRFVLAIVAAAAIMTAVFSSLEVLVGEGPETAGGLALDFLESLCLAAAMFGSALFVGRLLRVERETARLRSDIAGAAEAGAAWRRRSQRLLDGLGEAIALQFAEWHLTEAERDVAGLVIKGMSLKEIARARSTSEATIRQQAQSVYRKSGLSGRAELAAYFLEDVFRDARDGADAAPRPSA